MISELRQSHPAYPAPGHTNTAVFYNLFIGIEHLDHSLNSGVNGSVTLRDGLTQKGRYPGGWKSSSGVQGRRPNKGSSGRTPELITILEMDVKLELVLSTVTNPMGSL